MQTGDGEVFTDGRSTVDAVKVHKIGSLKTPAMSVAAK